MAGIETLRGAISASLSDSDFSAKAANLPDGELRQAIAVRLCGLDIVVVAATGLVEAPPHAAAEIIWQPGDGGNFVRQTVVWNIAPWALAQPTIGAAQADPVDRLEEAPSQNAAPREHTSVRAHRLTTFGR